MIKKLRDFFETELIVNALTDITITIEKVELERGAKEFTGSQEVIDELVNALNEMLRVGWELRLKIISILQSEFPDYHLKIQREIKKILEEEGDEDI